MCEPREGGRGAQDKQNAGGSTAMMHPITSSEMNAVKLRPHSAFKPNHLIDHSILQLPPLRLFAHRPGNNIDLGPQQALQVRPLTNVGGAE